MIFYNLLQGLFWVHKLYRIIIVFSYKYLLNTLIKSLSLTRFLILEAFKIHYDIFQPRFRNNIC